jgi:hypothetical protein
VFFRRGIIAGARAELSGRALSINISSSSA